MKLFENIHQQTCTIYSISEPSNPDIKTEEKLQQRDLVLCKATFGRQYDWSLNNKNNHNTRMHNP